MKTNEELLGIFMEYGNSDYTKDDIEIRDLLFKDNRLNGFLKSTGHGFIAGYKLAEQNMSMEKDELDRLSIEKLEKEIDLRNELMEDVK